MAAKPRIVLVTGSLRGGGAERVLSTMANYWARKGWDVTFATWSGADTEDCYTLDAGVHRLWLHEGGSADRGGRLSDLSNRVACLRAQLKKTRPDAVLSFISTSNVMTLLATRGLGLRTVVSERIQPAADNTISLPWRLTRRVVYRWADKIVVQSEDAARWVRRHCGRAPAVLANPLRALPEPGGARETLIVGIGRLAKQKGFDLLLRAFAQVASRFPDWRLAIVGEGGERATLTALCAELGLDARVDFAGHVHNVETWMARAGLIVQPSRFEGFPNVVLESMGMGAPVISANCPSGPAELIDDGVNGALVPVEDVAALAQTMAELLASPARRDALGQAATGVRVEYREARIMQLWEECLLPDYREHPRSTCNQERATH